MRTKGETHTKAGPAETPAPREPSDLLDLPRRPLVCYFRAWREGETPFRQTAFLGARWLAWVRSYLRNRFGPRYGPYPTHEGTDQRGIFAMTGTDPEGVLVSLASDWGTGTPEAAHVGWGIESSQPDYTIHLGDVYYVGTPQAVRQNMLGRSVDSATTRWPRGRLGSFALNANHEMYARGQGYFEDLLPELGLETPGGPAGQDASFFCLENDHWRVIGLDTGYNSVRKVPIEKLFQPSAKQPDAVLRWLEDDVRIREDGTRGIILLSHHQYYSAFDRQYPATARQLARLIRRPVLWFWGHEHRLGLYGRMGLEGGIEAWGRCMGHGGMPVEDVLDQPKPDRRATGMLSLHDRRPRPEPVEGSTVGYNGFVNLYFRGPRLDIEYRDIEPAPGGGVKSCVLLTETFTVESGGQLRGRGVELEPEQRPENWFHAEGTPPSAQA